MADRYANPYGPQTPIGAGLQNIATALFAGAGNRNRAALDEARADLYREQIDRGRAATALDDEKRRGIVAERNAVAAAPEEVLTALFGDRPRAQDFQRFRNAAPVTRTVTDEADPHFGVSLSSPMGRPEWLSPEIERDANDELRAIAYGMAGEGRDRASNIAQARDLIRRGRIQEDVLRGAVTPTRAAQAMYPFTGHDPFKQDAQGSVLDVAGGTVDQTNPIAQGNVKLLGSRASERDAAAGAQRALGALHGARQRQVDSETRSGVRVGPPVMVDDPEIGPSYTSPGAAVGRRPAARPVAQGSKLTLTLTGYDEDGNGVYEYVPQAAGQEVVKPPVGRPERPVELNAGAQKQLNALVARLFNAEDIAKVKDPASARAVQARAAEYYRTPGSGATGNAAQAVELAAKDVAPRGFNAPMFGGTEINGGPTAGLPQIAPSRPSAAQRGAAARPQPAAPAAPAAQPAAVREAYEAIQKGADPAAVRSRFKRINGFDLPAGA